MNNAYTPEDLGKLLAYTGIRLDNDTFTILWDKTSYIPLKTMKNAIAELRESSKRSISAQDIESMARKMYGRGKQKENLGSCRACSGTGFRYYRSTGGSPAKPQEYTARCRCPAGEALSRTIPVWNNQMVEHERNPKTDDNVPMRDGETKWDFMRRMWAKVEILK